MLLRHYFFIMLWLLLSLSSAQAGDITLLTGPKTGTYYAFGRDMASVMPAKGATLSVKETEGSLDNIRRISGSTTDPMLLGLVQSDALGFLAHSQNAVSKQMVSRLRVVLPLYQEEVHVLARKEIQAFRELQGKKVAIGEEGSGHMLTAVNLFALEQIVPAQIKKITPEEGVISVLQGDVDAVVLVGGKPMKIFKNMEDLTKPENQKFALLLQEVHFIPLSGAHFYATYEPTEITPRDYNFVRSSVPTIAVQALLISFDPAPTKEKDKKTAQARCASLKKFTDTLEAQLPTLRKSGHPKWQEVNLRGEANGWEKDSCTNL